MKKVFLINSNIENLPYPVAPLGISLVASSLLKNYQVKVFDFSFYTTEILIQAISDYKPDFIGISLRNVDNVTMRRCRWYLSDIKQQITEPIKKHFSVPLIIGGSGFSIAPKEILDYFKADYGVIGEAEEIFPQLLKEMGRNNKHPEIPGVISKYSPGLQQVTYNKKELHLPKANIDSYINFDLYKQRGNYPIQTKRGCTHKCIYCSYPKIEGNVYRLRPVNEIVDEIEDIYKRIPGVTFEFVDSTFNSPLKHAVNICKEIIRRDLKISLRTMGVNPGDVTDEFIQLMLKAGFAQIDCTPDSASAKMIKSYRKNFNKNRLIHAAEIIRKNNMPTMWFFMQGGPGETEETILETFEFIDKYIYEEDMVHITEGIRIIPGTELYTIALQQGVISSTDSVIKPMFYVDPLLGKDRLTEILEREISPRNNVMNSIDTAPSKELMQAAIKYRKENSINEPMFRTLLRIQNKISKFNP